MSDSKWFLNVKNINNTFQHKHNDIQYFHSNNHTCQFENGLDSTTLLSQYSVGLC
jgi:hypothetical protein